VRAYYTPEQYTSGLTIQAVERLYTGTDGACGTSAISPLRSYWVPGSYAPLLSEKRHSFLRLLKNKAFKEERRALHQKTG
jgi:hypothetical protein